MGINKKRFCCLATALLLAVTACGNFGASPKDAEKGSGDAAADNAADNNMGYGSALTARGISIPVSRPCIYVDRAGYVSGREKKVLFAGERHGETFDVVRSMDGAVVYTGRIPDGAKDGPSGRFFSVADFTELEEPGTYYIRTDIVGQSYPFLVAEDAYENLFLNMLRNVSNVSLQESPAGVCDVSFGMHAIMHALQCNGALFEAAYGHLEGSGQDRQLVTQLLYMAKWLISRQGGDGSIYGDYEATAAFCGIMTMSRDSFGRYEENVEKEYREAAQKAWGWLEGQACDTDERKAARFYAAAQLFKSDGGKEYKAAAEEFLRERKEDYSAGQFVFYGVLAYISGGTGIDRDLCTDIMGDMAERAKNISSKAEEDVFFGTGTRTAEGNMSNMLHLSFVNYVMPSKEYTVIIENTIQYMGGCNEDGICYMGADGVWLNTQEIQGRSFEWNGIMLLAMSDVLRNLRELE